MGGLGAWGSTSTKFWPTPRTPPNAYVTPASIVQELKPPSRVRVSLVSWVLIICTPEETDTAMYLPSQNRPSTLPSSRSEDCPVAVMLDFVSASEVKVYLGDS